MTAHLFWLKEKKSENYGTACGYKHPRVIQGIIKFLCPQCILICGNNNNDHRHRWCDVITVDSSEPRVLGWENYISVNQNTNDYTMMITGRAHRKNDYNVISFGQLKRREMKWKCTLRPSTKERERENRRPNWIKKKTLISTITLTLNMMCIKYALAAKFCFEYERHQRNESKGKN